MGDVKQFDTDANARQERAMRLQYKKTGRQSIIFEGNYDNIEALILHCINEGDQPFGIVADERGFHQIV